MDDVIINTGEESAAEEILQEESTEWQTMLLSEMRTGNDLLRRVLDNQESQRGSLELVPQLLQKNESLTAMITEQGTRSMEALAQLIPSPSETPTIVVETMETAEGDTTLTDDQESVAPMEIPVNETPAEKRRRVRTL